MRWQHNELRSTKLALGGGRSVIEIDANGFVINPDEYAEHALTQWHDVIGFQRVADSVPAPDEADSIGESETTQAPKKRTTRKKSAK